ncbi:MAG: hypothetical protein Fur0043_17640 [Anaerolineales bacterium]
MSTYSSHGAASALSALFRGRRISRGATWGMMIIGALLAFEIFNFSTTEFALNDVLGDLTFAGFRWATILSIAFCGIDFAGIARIFTPEQGRDEPTEVWYLFGAWLLAAAMNATLTWWGISIAILNHSSMGAGAVVSNTTLTKAVPVFVAIMVWLIRVLIIGTFSMAGDRLFSQADRPHSPARPAHQPQPSTATASLRPASSLPRPSGAYRPAPKPAVQSNFASRPDPTYHNLSFSERGSNERYK